MKILKKGQKFVAYRDESDWNNSDLNSQILIGDSIGQISIATEKFVGNTACIMQLSMHLFNFKEDGYISVKQQLIDRCLSRIKQDVEVGDLTAIDELLGFVPKKYLLGFL
jgi:hypothetical protein